MVGFTDVELFNVEWFNFWGLFNFFEWFNFWGLFNFFEWFNFFGLLNF